MCDLLSTLDELSLKQIDKVYGNDPVLKTLAKSVILNYDNMAKDAIINKIRDINQETEEFVNKVYDATIDSSFNIVPAKTGLEFWNNQPQIIVNGIAYNDVNEYLQRPSPDFSKEPKLEINII
jgi:hypothetical protein